MADSFWYSVIEKIAGTGLARQHNLAQCRKELLQSRINHQQRSERNSPRSKVSPENGAQADITDNLDRHLPPLEICGFKNVTEWVHNAHIASPPLFDYSEQDIRRRAHVMRAEKVRKSKRRRMVHGLLEAPPNPDPFHKRTANNFGTDFCVDQKSPSAAPSKDRATPARTRQVSDEELRLKETAARIGAACKVPDQEIHHAAPTAEELHLLRTKAWERHLGIESLPSSPEDTESVTVTKDGCIIQRGYKVSPNLTKTRLFSQDTERSDSLQPFDEDAKQSKSSQKRAHGSVRNKKGFRIPMYFRKREVSRQRRDSALSSSRTSPESDKAKPKGRNVVFFTGSISSDAIGSDSEEEGDNSHDTVPTSVSSSKDKGGSGTSVRVPSDEDSAKKPLTQVPEPTTVDRTEPSPKLPPAQSEYPHQHKATPRPQAQPLPPAESGYCQQRRTLTHQQTQRLPAAKTECRQQHKAPAHPQAQHSRPPTNVRQQKKVEPPPAFTQAQQRSHEDSHQQPQASYGQYQPCQPMPCKGNLRLLRHKPRQHESGLQLRHNPIPVLRKAPRPNKWLFSTIIHNFYEADTLFFKNRAHELPKPRRVNFKWDHVTPIHGFSDWKLCTVLAKDQDSTTANVWYQYTLDNWMKDEADIEQWLWDHFDEIQKLKQRRDGMDTGKKKQR